MTIEQFSEVVKFVQKHHAFAIWKNDDLLKEEKEKFPKMNEYGLCIKYVDCTYDSRESDVWVVKLRGMGNDIAFSTNHFTGINPAPKYFKFGNLYDWIMAYLKGEWHNNNILKTMEIKQQ